MATTDEKANVNEQTIGTNQSAASAGTSNINGAESPTMLQKFLAALVGEKEKAELPTEEKNEKKEVSTNGKSFSENDLKSAIEAEKQKWELERTERERLSKLPQEEREKTEKELQDKKIAELEMQLQGRRLKDTAIEEFKKEGFPTSLANLLNYSDDETMRKNLEELKIGFKSALADALKQTLKGKTPVGLGSSVPAEKNLRDRIAKNIRGGLR